MRILQEFCCIQMSHRGSQVALIHLRTFTGAGATDLAKAVQHASSLPSNFKYIYDLSLPIEAKIEAICKEIYRADGIELSGPCVRVVI